MKVRLEVGLGCCVMWMDLDRGLVRKMWFIDFRILIKGLVLK